MFKLGQTLTQVPGAFPASTSRDRHLRQQDTVLNSERWATESIC